MNIINNTEFPHFQFEKVGYFGELFSVTMVSQTFDLSNAGEPARNLKFSVRWS
jgi:hypothetical protein